DHERINDDVSQRQHRQLVGNLQLLLAVRGLESCCDICFVHNRHDLFYFKSSKSLLTVSGILTQEPRSLTGILNSDPRRSVTFGNRINKTPLSSSAVASRTLIVQRSGTMRQKCP